MATQAFPLNTFRRFVAPLILLAATALVFWQGLGGGFLLDDFHNIVTNKAVQIEKLDLSSLDRAIKAYPVDGTGRPLATLSLAINYWWSGTDPYSYKLTNLVIHAGNGWLVLLLILRLLGYSSLSERTRLTVGLLVGLAWALHPLQVSTVLYVVQRMELLATTFMLLALLAYLKGRTAQIRGERGAGLIVLSGFLMLTGMLAKESAVVFPALALGLELTILRFRCAEARHARRLAQAYAALFAVAILAYLTLVVPSALAPDNYALRDFTPVERLLSQARVLPMYIGQILVPLPGYLTFYYDNFEPSRGLFLPWTTAAGVALLALLAFGAWWLRHRAPLVALGIFWFFAGHALTSNVISLELVFEHRNYFPMLGILLAAALGLQWLARGSSGDLCLVAGAVLVLGFAGLAAIRSATWGDEFLLATDLAARNPTSPRASSELGTLYAGLSNGDPDSPFFTFAIKELERGAALPGASPIAEQALILLSASSGQPVRDEWWDTLLRKLRSQPVGPQELAAVGGLMKQRYEGMELDDRRLAEAYRVMLDARDLGIQYHVQFGDFAIRYLRDDAVADEAFKEVARMGKDDPGYINQVASMLAADGYLHQAELLLEESERMRSQAGKTAQPAP